MNWMRCTEQCDGPGQRLGQHRLAHAGDVLDQHVPLGQQHGERQPDGLGLALDDRLDGVADPVRYPDQVVERALGAVPISTTTLSSSSPAAADCQPPPPARRAGPAAGAAFRQYVLAQLHAIPAPHMPARVGAPPPPPHFPPRL